MSSRHDASEPMTARIVATKYLVNAEADVSEWITVELTCFAGAGPHRPLRDTWTVRQRGWCLDEDGDWIHVPLPSSRDAEFYERTRWDLDEALTRAQRAAARPSCRLTVA